MQDSKIPYLVINFTEDDPYTFNIEPVATYYPEGTSESVSTSPSHRFGYSWPTHAEIHDDLTEAVRRVLDRMQEFDSGEKVR